LLNSPKPLNAPNAKTAIPAPKTFRNFLRETRISVKRM
jgi:hypothetical protein